MKTIRIRATATSAPAMPLPSFPSGHRRNSHALLRERLLRFLDPFKRDPLTLVDGPPIGIAGTREKARVGVDALLGVAVPADDDVPFLELAQHGHIPVAPNQMLGKFVGTCRLGHEEAVQNACGEEAL